MTHLLLDELEVRRLMQTAVNYPIFRDYDAEWLFIKDMDELGEMKMPFPMIVLRDDVIWVGIALILIMFPEARNDNKIGEV